MTCYILAFLLGTLAGGAYGALRPAPGAGRPGRTLPALLTGLANGALWTLCFLRLGPCWDAALCCALASVLLAAALTDARTGEIPPLCSLAALVLGAARLLFDLSAWPQRLLGLVAVAGPLLLLLLLSKGRAIGGGDVKLLAGCGLFLGWKLIVLAFFLACILGSVIHLVRMRFFGAGRSLALGPYLAAAVFVSMLWGQGLLEAYLGLFR